MKPETTIVGLPISDVYRFLMCLPEIVAFYEFLWCSSMCQPRPALFKAGERRTGRALYPKEGMSGWAVGYGETGWLPGTPSHNCG